MPAKPVSPAWRHVTESVNEEGKKVQSCNYCAKSATGCTLEYDCSEVFREREIGIDLYCYACTCIYDTTSHRPSVVLTSETSRQEA